MLTIYNKVWQKVVSPKNIIEGKVYYNTVTDVLNLFDCDSRQISKVLKMITYDSDRNCISSYSMDGNDEVKWSDIAPDSMGDKILRKVCELFNN